MRHFGFVRAMAFAIFVGSLFAANSPSIPPSTAKLAPAVALPFEEVSTQAEATSDQLRDLDAALASDSTLAALEEEWPVFVLEVGPRIQESSKLIRANPSLETLRQQERSLVGMADTLDKWAAMLTRRAQQLDQRLNRLDQLSQMWDLTLSASRGQDLPPPMLKNIQVSIDSIQKARVKVEARRLKLMTVQNRIAEVDRRVDSAIDAVKQARSDLLDRLFVRDSPPIWEMPAGPVGVAGWIAEGRSSLAMQMGALMAYAEREQGRFLLQALWILMLVAVLRRTRKSVQALPAEEPEVLATARIFDSPVSMAIVLSIVSARWIYPQPPRLWWAVLSAVALFPATVMLRRLMAPKLFPLLDALVVFYLVDQVRLVAAAIPLLSRALLAAELLGAVIVLAYQGGNAARRRARFYLLLSLPACAFMASMLGYVNLATLLGEAVLGTAYAAVLLYSLVKVLEVLVMLALHQPPLIWLSAVLEHRGLIWRRLSWMLRGAGWFLWALIALEQLALRAPAVDWFVNILSATLKLGSLSLALGNVLAFVFTVWAAFQVSRLVRFLLNEDIYPRLHLAAGLPYAISMVLHYTILVVGFLAATAVLGVDMTKFTILAGAFGVGVGFGMQNVVNNFMSGLILLFERPVKIGDVIQVEDSEGRVETIGIRATTVRTSSGSRVIVPNGSLLASRVTNWSGSGHDRKIELQVAVDCGANPAEVIALLESAASEHPSISKSPHPQALFVKQGSGALTFELDAWTDQPARGVQIRSELALAVNAALTGAKIPIR